MSKKYVPSGYQIIDLDLSAVTQSGDSVTPTTEDEKILANILNNGTMNKPILLRIHNLGGFELCGFGIMLGGTISLPSYSMSGFEVMIEGVSNDEFIVNYHEI